MAGSWLGRWTAAWAGFGVVAIVLAGSGPVAAGGYETIIQDDAALLHRSDDEVRASLAQIKALGVDRVRLTAGWSTIAPESGNASRPQFDATDPAAYPAENWRVLDRAVRLTHEAGLAVMIDLAFWAPRWATSDSPGDAGGRERWNVAAAAFADFARATATRYSGSYRPLLPAAQQAPAPAPPPEPSLLDGLLPAQDPGQPEQPPPAAAPPSSEPLPRVDHWTIWNEPNHPTFLQPQWTGGPDAWRPHSPELYRTLVEAGYPAIKSVQEQSTVLVGGLSSTGTTNPRSATDGMAPLLFLRELACVDAQLKPVGHGSCASYRPLPGDGFAHHPYTLSRNPDFADPKRPDNLQIGALSRLTDTLDALAASGRISTRLREVYLTEFGYETNPPDPKRPFNPDQQARLLGWSEYLAWRNPRVRAWPQFLLRDMDIVGGSHPGGRYWDWQSGLYFFDGTAKPAATGFRLPLFAQCVPGRRGPRGVLVWGHVRPGAGARRVVLVTGGGEQGWRRARTSARLGGVARASAAAFATDAHGTFLRYTPFKRGAEYQFRLSSAEGRIDGSLAVRPVGCAGRAPRAR